MEIGGQLMLILVTYDVSTISKGGAKRLRKVSKLCQNYGLRVQNSVFECIVDSTQYAVLKQELIETIDSEHDSLRFYRLGENYQKKVEHVGVKESINVEGTLMF